MGFLDFLKGVGMVFEALAKLVPNFPKLVICMIKLIIISILYMLLSIPGIDILTTVLIHAPRYLLSIIIPVFIPLIIFIFVAIVALFDVILGSMFSGESTGAKMFRVISLFTTCVNDPRGWYRQRVWHRNNRFVRAFGVYPCMTPCFSGYEPSPFSGGMMCKRRDKGTPEYCTAAAVTRVLEGMSYKPAARVAVSSRDCDAFEKERMSDNQAALVRVVCEQPAEHGNDNVRVPCYERYCARPALGEKGPGSCLALVPFDSSSMPKMHVGIVPLLLFGGCVFFFSMVGSLRGRRVEYSRLES